VTLNTRSGFVRNLVKDFDTTKIGFMKTFYMKKGDSIIVPEGIEYLGDWDGYKLEDYQFPHILNKVLTGCGYTEYCLRNNQPLVLTSPRLFLLKNKEDQHQGHLEVFRVDNTIEKCVDFEVDINEEKERSEKKEKWSEEEKFERIEKLHREIREYTYKCAINHITPKILVTYDSFRHVKEALGDVINQYQIVVDEFQSIFIDARFKSDTEIELLHQLKGLQKVCYVSATPMLDKYLDMLPEFKYLPYYELDWKSEEPSRVIKPKLEIKFVRSLNEEAKRIINSYQQGKFDTRLGENGTIESREAVIFMNSVSSICQAIRSSKLHLEECNILCAGTDANDEKVRKAFNDVLKKETEELKVHPRIPKDTPVIGKIPVKGELHKMFTFCTRTVYLGADFYSTNARTFIFSDSNIDCLSVDISMDLEQILGRQRLKTNPWKNNAKMFVKTTSKKHTISKEEFDRRLEEKKDNSIKLLNSFNQVDDENKHVLAENYQIVAKVQHYKNNYVAVNVHAGKDLVPVFNNLMMVSEMRTFEVQQIDYADRFTVFNAVGERQVEGAGQEVEELFKTFSGLLNSKDKLKYLVEISEMELEKEDITNFLSLIPEKFREYYTEMGPDRIRANGYQESKLKLEWNKQHRDELGISEDLENSLIDNFKLGQRYSKSGIKISLKELYQKHGYEKTAKASDLQEYFWTKDVKILEDGKWVHGFEITGKK